MRVNFSRLPQWNFLFATAISLSATVLFPIDYCLGKEAAKQPANETKSSAKDVAHGVNDYQKSPITEELMFPPGDKPSITVAAALTGPLGTDAERDYLQKVEDPLEKPLLDQHLGKWASHGSDQGATITRKTIKYEGSDAEKMFTAMAPVLLRYHWNNGSFLELNYGKPSSKILRLSLPLVLQNQR